MAHMGVSENGRFTPQFMPTSRREFMIQRKILQYPIFRHTHISEVFIAGDIEMGIYVSMYLYIYIHTYMHIRVTEVVSVNGNMWNMSMNCLPISE